MHVWRLAVHAAPIAQLRALLSHDERERAARFAFDADRDQFIAVRGSLRRLLGDYLEQSPQQIRFAYGTEGKPRVEPRDRNDRELCFNVSHSGDAGVLAFRMAHEVGIDVEFRDRRLDVEELARRSFSPLEQHSMNAVSPDERTGRFFDIWTAKEACIKALGGGLSIPLQEFSVDVATDRSSWNVKFASARHGPTSVRPLKVPEGYSAAVTTFGNEWSVEVFDLPNEP